MHFTNPTDTFIYQVSIISLVVEPFLLRNTVMQYFYDLQNKRQNETSIVMKTELEEEINQADWYRGHYLLLLASQNSTEDMNSHFLERQHSWSSNALKIPTTSSNIILKM